MTLGQHLARHASKYLFVTALVLLALLWDWNWFRPLVQTQLASQLQRPVAIGHFDLDLGRSTTVRLQGLEVGNPQDFATDTPPLVQIQTLALTLDSLGLFQHRVSVQALTLVQPVLHVAKNANGRSNAVLPPSSGGPSAWAVEVLKLAIENGRFAYDDPAGKATFRGSIQTQAADDDEDRVVARAEGRYQDAPLQARFTGGSLLALRDAAKPYPVDFALDTGNTHITLKGSLLDPVKLAGAALQLQLAGDDLAKLFPLVPVALPHTAAYRLSGALDYTQGTVRFKDFAGVLGSSDLSGTASVRRVKTRPVLEADLSSKQLLLADLAGLIGATPGKPGSPNDTAALAAQRAAAAAKPTVLPGDPISLPKLHAADVHVHYRGARIVGEQMPLDDVEFQLDIVNGTIKVSPVQFGVGEGHIEVYATLDNAGQDPRLDVLANLRKVDASKLLGALGKAYKGDGRIGGRIELKTHGQSVAEWLGSGNGRVQLFMSGGNFSAVLLDLAGLDFGNAVVSALGIPSRTEIRCLVGDLPLENGLLSAKTVVLDTGSANLVIDGSTNLARETLDLRAQTEPKRLNIGRLRAPIHISGTLKNPRVLPDLTQLGLRGAASVALGVLLTPAAALIPTLQLGLGEDHNCQALMTQASAETAAKNAR
jgi:AsmA family protein